MLSMRLAAGVMIIILFWHHRCLRPGTGRTGRPAQRCRQIPGILSDHGCGCQLRYGQRPAGCRGQGTDCGGILKIASGLGSTHLHTAKALREELSIGGFNTATVHGVMGGAWLAPNLDALLENEETKAVLMKTVRMMDTHEEIIGLSGHLLAVSRKNAYAGY